MARCRHRFIWIKIVHAGTMLYPLGLTIRRFFNRFLCRPRCARISAIDCPGPTTVITRRLAFGSQNCHQQSAASRPANRLAGFENHRVVCWWRAYVYHYWVYAKKPEITQLAPIDRGQAHLMCGASDTFTAPGSARIYIGSDEMHLQTLLCVGVCILATCVCWPE